MATAPIVAGFDGTRDHRVALTIVADSSQFEAELARIVTRFAKSTLPTLVKILAKVQAAIAGIEAQYYVRAGLDPAYATPEPLEVLVRNILSGQAEEGMLRLLSPADRAGVAASAIRGWVTHRPQIPPAEVLVWVRHLDGQRVWVTTGGHA